MVSILQVDGLAKRYGMLPSKVICEADSFDLYIMDCALTFEQYHHKKAANGGKDPLPDYTENELLDMIGKIKK
jgi:hypothetical protein